MKLIYLASPYTHPDKWMMELRHAYVTIIGAKLVTEGHHIFGPITESHMYQQYLEVGTAWNFWEKHDKLMMRKCDELWVIKLNGWEESVGVTAEIEYAKRIGKTIKYIEPTEILPELKDVLI